MTDIRKVEDHFKNLPEHQKNLPANAKFAGPSMTIDAARHGIDTTKQQLRSLRPFGSAVAQIPSLLPAKAQIVLQALLACFERQMEVKEGILDDLVWGFQQINIPIPVTVQGLLELQEAGYVKFQAPDGTYLTQGGKLEKAWVRYEPKLMELVYE